jgi:hypothetical protein
MGVQNPPPSSSPSATVPLINARLKTEETLFPQADGVTCNAMVKRRSEIFPPSLLIATFPGYDALENKMKQLLGFTEKVDWLTIREVLTCHRVHGIDLIQGIEEEERKIVDKLTGWMWGVLYKVKDILKYISPSFLYFV